jgi:copper homeostasis protein
VTPDDLPHTSPETKAKTGRDATRVLLEVAVASLDDALVAVGAGADRLELNAALALGGLTPSLGTLIEVKQAVAIPVVVMIRPRPGGFAYTAAEFRVMQRDTDLALAHGADGIAFGILQADGQVDAERNRRLVEQIGDLTAVFHRAFDVTPDASAALEELIALGFQRVMTSGQMASALLGADTISALIRQAAGRIEILPAAGINAQTAAAVLGRTGCEQLHASLRGHRTDPSTRSRPEVRFGSRLPASEEEYEATDPAAVAELVARLRRDSGVANR